MNRSDLSVGQAVTVIYPKPSYSGGEERRYPGIITKIGRTLATVEWTDNSKYASDAQFRIETGRIRSDIAQTYDPYFRTPEAEEDDRRRAAAIATLDVHSVEFGYSGGRKLNTAQLEAMVAAIEDNAEA